MTPNPVHDRPCAPGTDLWIGRARYLVKKERTAPDALWRIYSRDKVPMQFARAAHAHFDGCASTAPYEAAVRVLLRQPLAEHCRGAKWLLVQEAPGSLRYQVTLSLAGDRKFASPRTVDIRHAGSVRRIAEVLAAAAAVFTDTTRPADADQLSALAERFSPTL